MGTGPSHSSVCPLYEREEVEEELRGILLSSRTEFSVASPDEGFEHCRLDPLLGLKRERVCVCL